PEPEPTPTDPPAAPAEGGATVERTFALDGVSAPWGLAVLPDGDLLVGSRDTGTVHRLNPDTGDTTTVGTVQAAEPGSGRGLLGLDTDGSHVYAFYSTASDSRVSRFVYSPDRAEGSQLSPAQGLVTGMPIESVANGGAVALGPDELLYAATAQGRPGEGTAGDVLTRVTLAGNDPDASHGPGGRIASGDPGVRAFDWDQVGRLWYLAGDGMLRCLEAGAAPGSATQQDVGLPEGAAGLVYASAALWVSDPLTDVLWRLPLDGADPVADATAVSLGTSESLGVVRAADGDRLWALSGSELLEISVS
ncbi:PQQ-dependent sugar dehydrogenase, partial [Streptomyces lonarensis]